MRDKHVLFPTIFISKAAYERLHGNTTKGDREENLMDDLKKRFEVLAISRELLLSLGMSEKHVASLTDEDMKRIADILIAHHFDHEFDEEVMFTARVVLEERNTHAKPIRKDREGHEQL